MTKAARHAKIITLLEQREVRVLARQQLFLHDRRRDARGLSRARLGDQDERSRCAVQVRKRIGNHGIDRKRNHHRVAMR